MAILVLEKSKLISTMLDEEGSDSSLYYLKLGGETIGSLCLNSVELKLLFPCTHEKILALKENAIKTIPIEWNCETTFVPTAIYNQEYDEYSGSYYG